VLLIAEHLAPRLDDDHDAPLARPLERVISRTGTCATGTRVNQAAEIARRSSVARPARECPSQMVRTERRIPAITA
jgi:hypothetical protein